jgi:hypothetical protein
VHINAHKIKILHAQHFERACIFTTLFLTIRQCALDDVAIISEEAMAASYGCAADSGTQLYM